VLLVEDEEHLAAGIAENLELEGHQVEVESHGLQALRRLGEAKFDLVILDVMLPGLDGFALCRLARERGVEAPVLFLTARGAAADRIQGLRAGGDDYLAKPFHLEELLLRVRAILRRARTVASADEAGENGEAQVLEFGGNRVDLKAYRGVSFDGVEQELTHKEAQILKLLARRAGEVVSRDEILDRVWGLEEYPTARTIDNFVLRLRRRFERTPEEPRHFHTVRGVGYRFTVEEE
jgi:two-component system alkaline phosphatase synthesis response regulator PhoP